MEIVMDKRKTATLQETMRSSVINWYVADGTRTPDELGTFRLVERAPWTDEAKLVLVDTFDWGLARSGTLTLVAGEGSKREEIRLPIASPAPEPVRLKEALPAPTESSDVDLVPEERKHVEPRQLLQLGAGTIARRVSRVVDHNMKTVARAEEIMVKPTGRGHQAIRLIGLAPLRGFAKLLPAGTESNVADRLAVALAETVGRRPFDYGQALRLGLTGDATVAEMHERVTEHLLAVCAWNEPGILRRVDVEFLHDFRVALRRLRSYLNALQHKDTKDASRYLKQLWDLTGRARDLDVFAERRDLYVGQSPEAIHFEVAEVFAHVDQWRDQAYTDLARALRGGALGKLRKAIAGIEPAAADRPAGPLAEDSLKKSDRRFEKSVKRLVKAYRQTGESMNDAQIHAARIRAKKRRYIAEIMAPLAPHSLCARPMRKLQNLLGSYNDLVVEEALFLSILHERPAELEALRAGVAYMLARVESEKREARHQVMLSLKKEIV